MACVVLRAFLLLSFMVLCSGLSIKVDRKKRSYPFHHEGPCEIIGDEFCNDRGGCLYDGDDRPYCDCYPSFTGDRCQDEEVPITTEPPTTTEVTWKTTTGPTTRPTTKSTTKPTTTLTTTEFVWTTTTKPTTKAPPVSGNVETVRGNLVRKEEKECDS